MRKPLKSLTKSFAINAMQKKTGRKLKILHIMDILYHNTDFEHPMTAARICQELEKRGIPSERKSVYGDIAALKEFGMDIRLRKSEKTGFYLSGASFRASETELLCKMVDSASFIDEKNCSELLKKLSSLSGYGGDAAIKSLSYIDKTNKTANTEVLHNTEIIGRAAALGKKVDFLYSEIKITPSGIAQAIRKKVTASPCAAALIQGEFYLIGLDEDKLIKHWRIDKITRMRQSGEKSAASGVEFDPEAYIPKCFGGQGGEPTEAELLCKNEILEKIIDRFGEDTFIRRYDGGNFTVKIKAFYSEGLISYIMGFGDKIRVLSPESLKSIVCETAVKTAGRYE